MWIFIACFSVLLTFWVSLAAEWIAREVRPFRRICQTYWPLCFSRGAGAGPRMWTEEAPLDLLTARAIFSAVLNAPLFSGAMTRMTIRREKGGYSSSLLTVSSLT